MRTGRLLLAVCALALAAVSGGARGDPQTGTAAKPGAPAKASSFAPHHTSKRTFGAPIQPPILHKRHKHAARPVAPAATAHTPEPVK